MSSPVRGLCPVQCHARARPDALALWTETRRWTYTELDAAVAATRARLQERGVERGSRVALRLRRGPDAVLLLWALRRLSAVAVPLSTRLPAGQCRKAAQQLGATQMITHESSLLGRSGEPLAVSPDRVVEEEGRGEPLTSILPLDQPATILFTSGSTGAPKPIRHSWASHVYSAKGSNANIPLHPGNRWLLSLPLYHVGGLAILVRCALAGAAVAIPDPEASVSSALDTTDASHASFVATQLRRVLDATDGMPPVSLQALLLGGGPIPDPLLRRGHHCGWPLHTSYGSTEMASQITATPPGAPLDDLRTAGRRLPHRRLRIEDGQILVSGRTRGTAVGGEGAGRNSRSDGWAPSGDLGHLDASGRLHIKGRVDRQFVSGGENIQPKEIETALEALDGVQRAVVVSIPDPEFGRRPVGFVRTETGRLPSRWEHSLEATLPRFKIPEALHELPEAAVQDQLKVDHGMLRRRARGARGKKRGVSAAEE